jgi:ABC-type oligopeptide transport system substrate-binding subunit
MKSLKKLGIMSAGVLTLALSACGEVCPKYMRDSDYGAYEVALGNFGDLYAKAQGVSDDSERFVQYALAEAALLDSATLMPTTTQGGNYAITRVAPRTVPYSFWGNDSDRLAGTVIVKKGEGDKAFIKKGDRAALLAKWEAARKGEGTYDPAAELKALGYEIGDTFSSSYQTFPETLDVLNTSMQADTESLVNAVEGLLEYDNFGVAHGKIAKSWDVEKNVDEEGNVYDVWTFELNEGRKWYKADGTEYGVVSGDDFVAGFQHMLDAQAGLEWLADGVVAGVHDYLSGKTKDFSKVGIKAEDNKLTFTLEKEESFFPTRLSYSCFMPMNRAFFLAQGGAFGIEEFKKASTAATYKYGLISDRTTAVYNGPYVPNQLTDGTIIKYTLNPNYPDADKISTKTLSWIYDAGENPTAYYGFAVAGDINGCGLGAASGLLAKAKEDGNFDKYAYIADTNATTFFGGFNVNRGTFETGSVKSTQTEAEKEFTHRAMNNKNFRMALQHAWDRAKWNAVSTGDELAAKNLRNSYTQPEFVSLTKDVVYEEHTFAKGTSYGELIEYFLKNTFKRNVKIADGQDGWYNADLAKQYLASFKEEIGDNVNFPIKLDVTYFSGSAANTAQAKAFEQIIEDVLGKDSVDVVLNAAETSTDYYAAGYRAANGEAGNFDVFYGSGWGPDYGDPSTYLDTFLGDGAGYMTKVVGLF